MRCAPRWRQRSTSENTNIATVLEQRRRRRLYPARALLLTLCLLPLRCVLRRCFFPVEDDDIIDTIRFSFRDVNDDSDDEAAKLEHRGGKEETNTADGILSYYYGISSMRAREC